MINKQIILGKLQRDPEFQMVGENELCKFDVCTWHYNTQKKENEYTYHKIVVWGKQAKNCADMLVKGSMVYVEGRTSKREYENKEGIKKNSVDVICDIIRFVADFKKNEYKDKPTQERPSQIQAEAYKAPDNKQEMRQQFEDSAKKKEPFHFSGESEDLPF